MTTAFVLSGGGGLGAVQVGMLQALAARKQTPDLLVGTSAGALNASYIAGFGTTGDVLDALAEIWIQLRRGDVFPLSPSRHLLALLVPASRSLQLTACAGSSTSTCRTASSRMR